jgi:hypothetical protein
MVWNETSGEWESWNESWVPLFTKVKWNVTYYVPNNSGETMYYAVLIDRFGAELDHNDHLTSDPKDYSYSASQGSVMFWYSSGKMKQLRVTWSIGNIPDGTMATLSFEVVTKQNPAGKQEYTSPGLKILNSGAVLKWVNATGHQDSMSTPSCYVMAGNTLGAIVGTVTECGDPVSSARVELWTTDGIPVLLEIDKTDKHGFYYFPKVYPSNYTVRYDLTNKSAEVTAGNITTVNFDHCNSSNSSSSSLDSSSSEDSSSLSDRVDRVMTLRKTLKHRIEGRRHRYLPFLIV